MKKLTLEEYKSMPHDVRTALRRKAFGCPRVLPPQLEGQFDLDHLAQRLLDENEITGWFPGRWTDEEDLEGFEDLV